MTEQEKARDIQRVQQALLVLGEHFDAVQIFVTRNTGEEDGNTVSLAMGAGNWFARYGHVREWIIKKDEEARADARKDSED